MATKAVAKRFGSVKAAKSALKSNRSNGALKRLNADQTLKVRFMTEPDDWYEAHYHWIGKEFLWCNQQTSCAGCKTGDRPKTTVLANAVIFGSDDEKDMNRVVVMQMTATLANTLLKFHEKRGTLLDRDYDLMREGSGLNDTVYSADPDDPKKRNMARFEKYMHDIEAIINAELGDDEEDEDDEPRSSKTSSKKKSSRREDNDEYEDEDEDDEEEEEDERPRRSSRRTVSKKKPARRSSHEDEDDEEDEEDEEEDYEDERPSKSRKSKYDGLNEFKSKKSKTRAVVRRSR